MPPEPSAVQWVTDRLESDTVHLDVAACGRVSTTALMTELAHLRAEGGGGYVAQALAEPLLADGRAALAALVGLAGADVAFLESAAGAFAVLLAGWPLTRGARVGTVPSEYGGNARLLRALAGARGWELVDLPVDPSGRVTDVPAGLELVTFPHVASQRGVVQPVAEVLAAGVPLVLDVAQSLGQTAVPPGAAAYVGTSRKWLCGPRGVGFVVVDPSWEGQLSGPPTLPFTEEGVRRLESPEAHVAGRVGLAVAVQEWHPALLPVVHERAADVRTALAGSGWGVAEPVDEPSGITTLLPPAGAEPGAVRDELLADGFLTSAVPTSRAADMTEPVLRVSTAAWVTGEQVDRFAAALRRRTPR